jgi:hypothetical protein
MILIRSRRDRVEGSRPGLGRVAQAPRPFPHARPLPSPPPLSFPRKVTSLPLFHLSPCPRVDPGERLLPSVEPVLSSSLPSLSSLPLRGAPWPSPSPDAAAPAPGARGTMPRCARPLPTGARGPGAVRPRARIPGARRRVLKLRWSRVVLRASSRDNSFFRLSHALCRALRHATICSSVVDLY